MRWAPVIFLNKKVPQAPKPHRVSAKVPLVSHLGMYQSLWPLRLQIRREQFLDHLATRRRFLPRKKASKAPGKAEAVKAACHSCRKWVAKEKAAKVASKAGNHKRDSDSSKTPKTKNQYSKRRIKTFCNVFGIGFQEKRQPHSTALHRGYI